MNKGKIAINLYSLRDLLKTTADIAATLKMVKMAGYDGIEVSAIGPIDNQEFKNIVDSQGLEICVADNGMKNLRSDAFPEVVAQMHTWGCRSIAVGDAPGEYPASAGGYLQFAKDLDAVSLRLADSGIQLLYHNHAKEFFKYDGVRGIEYLFNAENWKSYQAQLDVHWVQRAGCDPAEWIEKLKGHMTQIHFKEYYLDVNGNPDFVEVGVGNLNWKSIVAACKNIDIEWYIVEQDTIRIDPSVSIAKSCRAIRSWL